MKKWQAVRAERVAGNPDLEKEIQRNRAIMQFHMALDDLRRRRGLSQTELADELGMGQRNVSRIEHTEDLMLSTLAGYIAGLGGRLEVHAVFDDEEDVVLASMPGNGAAPKA